MNAAVTKLAGRPEEKQDSKSKARKVTRVQLDLPPRSMERLSAMKEKTEASSYAEVIRRALQVYEDLVNSVNEGEDFLIRKRDGSTSLYKVFL